MKIGKIKVSWSREILKDKYFWFAIGLGFLAMNLIQSLFQLYIYDTQWFIWIFGFPLMVLFTHKLYNMFQPNKYVPSVFYYKKKNY